MRNLADVNLFGGLRVKKDFFNSFTAKFDSFVTYTIILYSSFWKGENGKNGDFCKPTVFA